jgi:hypothetical protein
MDKEIIEYKITKYVDKLKNAKTAEEADKYRQKLTDYHNYNKRLLFRKLPEIPFNQLKQSIAENYAKCQNCKENPDSIAALEKINKIMIETDWTSSILQEGGGDEISMIHADILTNLHDNPFHAQKLLS